MKKRWLKILGVGVLVFFGIQAALVAYLCYELSDERLHIVAKDMLESILDTDVEIESVKLKPLDNSIAIHGFDIKDQQSLDLLHVDTLTANINFWRLLRNEVTVTKLNLAGAKAGLYKASPEAEPNYQFAVDALNFYGDKQRQRKVKHETGLIMDLRKITVSRTSVKWDVLSEEVKNTEDHKQLDVNHLWVHDLSLALSLQSGSYPGAFTGKLDYLTVDEHNSNTTIDLADIRFDAKERHMQVGDIRLAYQDKRLEVKDLKADYSGTTHPDSVYLKIQDIIFENGIGVAERPANPARGAFDAKHLKLNLSLEAAAAHLSTDSLAVQVHHMKGKDERSGLTLDDLRMTVYKNRTHAWVKDFVMLSGHNSVSTDEVRVTLPRYGAEKHPWSFDTNTIRIKALLQEISHAFTPALKNFTTPLYATTIVHGDPAEITMHDIKVYTADKRVTVNATGLIVLPKQKGEKIDMTFDVSSMKAHNDGKQKILAHFIPKKKTLDLMNDFGDVGFHGRLHIPYHKVYIDGMVETHFGNLKTDVLLNSETAFMTGRLSAEKFLIGKFLDNKNLGPISVEADVKMDIASKRKAKMLHRAKGKIPMGSLKGKALTASYMGLTLRNVEFDIVSDAKTATGTLGTKGKGVDLSCDFSFNDTDIKHSLKVKPHVKVKIFE